MQLPDPDASKVQWTLNCYNGKGLFPISYVLFILLFNEYRKVDLSDGHPATDGSNLILMGSCTHVLIDDIQFHISHNMVYKKHANFHDGI